jgi:hypothetical protein
MFPGRPNIMTQKNDKITTNIYPILPHFLALQLADAGFGETRVRSVLGEGRRH